MNRILLTSALLLAAVSAALAGEVPPASSVPPAIASAPAKAPGPKLVEPHLHIARSNIAGHPRIALTFDACMGQADERILSTLVRERIPATIFVTARWLKRNPATLAVFLQNADLFELENHGENHIPAVDTPTLIYGIASAGSPQAVRQEVEGGAAAMIAAGIPAPHWFRGSTAKYDLSAIGEIRNMGFRIAGYSINGDGGSLLGAAITEKRIASAKDGDVVISHINQPTHAAGEGVVKALVDLKAKGTEFVRLEDVEDTGDDKTTE
ncbi:polysaccharide deacetylase family protein [Rhizobium lentis]|uniref:Chitooligosaccharide deacetylase n=1 Tax=Rhizobium lentis TaxID=1138194 RepID=A0A9Q3M7B1_9HYPH|nr:polysaccharide deacetylase family protein [Rhizobium lentis]MBX5001530.1 polysaccharide deacetylase family protein [Rhizobium lentis]MBX5012911.1 polysaccharide deacetylase family protein [Rhizobium lentis]MBX5019002.1 polysaccharide deacetylase family protein [Rhizobium lentis]MBX5022651.1 polysaccharide deacetylase family protein [Rhizobium lentis]MBX5067505.1 polysaccharide deacetylase family protein [Rhizobium lentis]